MNTKEISHVTCKGPGKPIVFHLTPFGVKEYSRRARARAKARKDERVSHREFLKALSQPRPKRRRPISVYRHFIRF